jgi:hypothetical protein
MKALYTFMIGLLLILIVVVFLFIVFYHDINSRVVHPCCEHFEGQDREICTLPPPWLDGNRAAQYLYAFHLADSDDEDDDTTRSVNALEHFYSPPRPKTYVTRPLRYTVPQLIISMHAVIAPLCSSKPLPSSLNAQDIKEQICPAPLARADRQDSVKLNEYAKRYRKSLAGIIHRKTYGYIKLPYENVEVTIHNTSIGDYANRRVDEWGFYPSDIITKEEWNRSVCHPDNDACLVLRYSNSRLFSALNKFLNLIRSNNLSEKKVTMLILPCDTKTPHAAANFNYPDSPVGHSIITTPTFESLPINIMLHEMYHTFGLGHANHSGREYADPTCVLGGYGCEGYLNVAHANFLKIAVHVDDGYLNLNEIYASNSTFERSFMLPRTWRSYKNHVKLEWTEHYNARAIYTTSQIYPSRVGYISYRAPFNIDLYSYFISYAGFGYREKKRRELKAIASLQGFTPPDKRIGICVYRKSMALKRKSELIAFIPLTQISVPQKTEKVLSWDNFYEGIEDLSGQCIKLESIYPTDGPLELYMYIRYHSANNQEAKISVTIGRTSCKDKNELPPPTPISSILPGVIHEPCYTASCSSIQSSSLLVIGAVRDIPDHNFTEGVMIARNVNIVPGMIVKANLGNLYTKLNEVLNTSNSIFLELTSNGQTWMHRVPKLADAVAFKYVNEGDAFFQMVKIKVMDGQSSQEPSVTSEVPVHTIQMKTDDQPGQTFRRLGDNGIIVTHSQERQIPFSSAGSIMQVMYQAMDGKLMTSPGTKTIDFILTGQNNREELIRSILFNASFVDERRREISILYKGDVIRYNSIRIRPYELSVYNVDEFIQGTSLVNITATPSVGIDFAILVQDFEYMIGAVSVSGKYSCDGTNSVINLLGSAHIDKATRFSLVAQRESGGKIEYKIKMGKAQYLGICPDNANVKRVSNINAAAYFSIINLDNFYITTDVVINGSKTVMRIAVDGLSKKMMLIDHSQATIYDGIVWFIGLPLIT